LRAHREDDGLLLLLRFHPDLMKDAGGASSEPLIDPSFMVLPELVAEAREQLQALALANAVRLAIADVRVEVKSGSLSVRAALGGVVALVTKEDLRSRLLDAVFGPEEQFEYDSVTEPVV
jgi:hypothetical protein